MIKRVLNGEEAISAKRTREELEVAAECLERGYLYPASNQIMNDFGKVKRMMDFSPVPMVDRNSVPVKGLAFLKPDRSELRSKAALWISLGAFLISLLSNIDVIARNVTAMISYLINLV